MTPTDWTGNNTGNSVSDSIENRVVSDYRTGRFLDPNCTSVRAMKFEVFYGNFVMTIGRNREAPTEYYGAGSLSDLTPQFNGTCLVGIRLDTAARLRP